MRLRCSSDLGLSHGGLVAIGLLLYALRALPCFTCAQEWILLSTNLTATGMVVMSAFLFQPVKPAAGQRMIMQVPQPLPLPPALLQGYMLVSLPAKPPAGRRNILHIVLT